MFGWGARWIGWVALVATLLLACPAAAAPGPYVVVTPTGAAGALTLNGTGIATQYIVRIASIEGKRGPGFTNVAISSGSLTKAGGTPIPFQIALVDLGVAAPVAADFNVASGATYNWDPRTSGRFADIYILYTTNALQDPGTYTYTVSITMN